MVNNKELDLHGEPCHFVAARDKQVIRVLRSFVIFDDQLSCIVVGGSSAFYQIILSAHFYQRILSDNFISAFYQIILSAHFYQRILSDNFISAFLSAHFIR